MCKKAYRVRNWKHYNKALVERGNITFWLSEEVLAHWQPCQKKKTRGRPFSYSTLAIECGLTLKALFKLPLRATQGLIKGLMKLLGVGLKSPHYSLLCKRQREVSIRLPRREMTSDEKINIVMDTTGIKVYGEGEWKVRQHGWVKRRLWRKLHVAVNVDSHEIEACELTDLGLQDGEGFSLLVSQIEKQIDDAACDGAYDQYSCYEEAERGSFRLITPPHRNARTSKERPRNKKKASAGAVQKRDEAILKVRELGRKEWKKTTGYHRRSLAETAIFRIKTLLSSQFSTRKLAHQKVETAIWCKILNKMTGFGMPQSVAI